MGIVRSSSMTTRRIAVLTACQMSAVDLAGHAEAIGVSQLGREVARRREVGKVDVNPRSVTPLGSTWITQREVRSSASRSSNLLCARSGLLCGAPVRPICLVGSLRGT